MKIGNKAEFTESAPVELIGRHRCDAVLIVTGALAGIVFLRDAYSQIEFIAYESEVQVLAEEEAQRRLHERHQIVTALQREYESF